MVAELWRRFTAWVENWQKTTLVASYEEELDAAVAALRDHGAAAVPDETDPAPVIERLKHAAWIWRTGVCLDCFHDECREAGDALVLARAIQAHGRLRRLDRGN